MTKALCLILGLLIWTLGFPILFAATGWPTPTAVLVVYGAGIFGIGMALEAIVIVISKKISKKQHLKD
jgi:hypothetical protein